MTENELEDFSISEIVQDLKAILNCLQICMYNKVEASIYEGFIFYLCTFIYSGNEYLEDHNVIPESDNKSFKKKVEKSRSKFLKQYAEFTQGTYEKLNKFNRDEYIKFFLKAYPNVSPIIVKEIKNYYIASINNKPIDNYHLSSGILGCEIGSYIDDITPQIQSYVYQMVSFVGQILSAAQINIESDKQNISFEEVKYADIDMAYKYKNFAIQDNPPILMALMDILCIVNSYNEVFIKINSYERLDLKVKYLILFENIRGLIKIIEFCRASKIDLNIDNEFNEFIEQIDKSYCRNQLRRYCAHYGYKETDWKSDPIVEVFEKHFKKPIGKISRDLSEQILKLGDYLNGYVIKIPFANLD